MVVKILELILGVKATSTMLPRVGEAYAEGEIILKLTEPHLSFVEKMMVENSISLDKLKVTDGFGSLVVRRKISSAKSGSKSLIKSECSVNGKTVTLKTLKTITSQLIAIVDASAAAVMLSQPQARMNIIDTGVPSDLQSKTRRLKIAYRNARKNRERIERELANRVLPSSFNQERDGQDLELYRHWIDELDDFEKRMNNFKCDIFSEKGSLSVINYKDDSVAQYDNRSITSVLQRLRSKSWREDANVCKEERDLLSDSFYSSLLDLRDVVKHLDSKLISAHASCQALTSLSQTASVAFSLEESRRHLFDVAAGSSDEAISSVTEKCHDLLNQLEEALNEAARFIEDDSKGLISTLERIRQGISISADDLDVYIGDWGALSRKHGISPYSLPMLQKSLREELDGNVEAKAALPKAQKAEIEALREFEEACKILSSKRLTIATSLSKAVTEQIANLGMESSVFAVDFRAMEYSCTDNASFSENSILGLDTCDFKLIHDKNYRVNSTEMRRSENNERGGKLEVVGSSGEKARILLAIETILPGSVGASCNRVSTESISDGIPPPVAVVYDEIDAHVGGRAVVALAKLLSAQTRPRNNSNGSQIISITHSPSIAAIADNHVVVQKVSRSNVTSDTGGLVVVANTVEGAQRREEIARMASGDLARDEEGLRFADALLRGTGKY